MVSVLLSSYRCAQEVAKHKGCTFSSFEIYKGILKQNQVKS